MSQSINDNPIKLLSAEALRRSFNNIRWSYQGKVIQVVGTMVEAVLPGCQLGTIVNIKVPGRHDTVLGEVVGFRDDKVILLPYTHLHGVSPGCFIEGISQFTKIPAGDFLLGRVIDPFMNPLAGGPLKLPEHVKYQDIENPAPNPLERKRIEKKLGLGVRAIDSLLTFGLGQRVGIMAGSGVGKSVLMGMIARSSDADVNVIALIGERGREVREFIERDLGPEGLAKSVVITVTSDQSPLMRIRGAKVATAIAEHFASRGQNVMLMVDSLTRVAMAQREVGNAVGEPPTTKGYTPSVFSLLPKLLERAGPQMEGHGDISAIYTVLVDGDDFNDPISDAARSLLDGHINLSRSIAAKGMFPAIDITTSASRVMNDIVDRTHWRMANQFRTLLGVFKENFDLVQIGAYQQGTNPRLDEAIQLMPMMERYLKQDMNERSNLDDAIRQLGDVLEGKLDLNRAVAS